MCENEITQRQSLLHKLLFHCTAESMCLWTFSTMQQNNNLCYNHLVHACISDLPVNIWFATSLTFYIQKQLRKIEILYCTAKLDSKYSILCVVSDVVSPKLIRLFSFHYCNISPLFSVPNPVDCSSDDE